MTTSDSAPAEPGPTVPQPSVEVHHYSSPDALAEAAAGALLAALARRQADGGTAQLCLTGGRIAGRLYSRVADLVGGSALDPDRLELWWGDDQFLPTDDPSRNAGHALALLASGFAIRPALTHPMPSADGVTDAAASAATYAKELGDTVFDVCLLGLGADGHVASIFPEHPSFTPTQHTVIAVNDAPQPPHERVSLSVTALNRSREVWFLVSGAEKAEALTRAVQRDPAIPAGVVRGLERTVWFIDEAAAAPLPYYDCAF